MGNRTDIRGRNIPARCAGQIRGVHAIGWRACFFITVLPALLVVFIRKRLPESDMWLERKRLISEGTPLKKALESESNNKFLMLFSGTYRGIFIQCLILAIFDMS